jgi:hypothetical protein
MIVLSRLGRHPHSLFEARGNLHASVGADVFVRGQIGSNA